MLHWRVRIGDFEETFTTAREAVGTQQAGTPPPLDGVGLNVQTLGDLLLGQQASFPQPLVSASQMVLLANSSHYGVVEFVTPCRSHSQRIELTCNFDVGVVLQKLVDQFDDGC